MNSYFYGLSRALAITAISLLLLSSCSDKKNSDSDTTKIISNPDKTVFHADNDIAMMVMSMVDAIRVGENLDSMRYNNGEIVLTDGQGTPLYTDVQESPGAWDVKVVSPHHAIISNLYLGDLTPEFLREYVVGALKLDSTNMVKDRPESDLESRLVVYDFNGGFIGFDSKIAKAENGREGPLMHIILSADEHDVH